MGLATRSPGVIPGTREKAPDHSNFATFKPGPCPPVAADGPREETPRTIRKPDANFPNADITDLGPHGELVPPSKTGTTLPHCDGPVLFNKYEVLRELGAGGMGRVYLVR